MKQCGEWLPAGVIIQYQNIPSLMSAGSTDGTDGMAISTYGDVYCDFPKDHDAVHGSADLGGLVSWPWDHIGNGGYVWGIPPEGTPFNAFYWQDPDDLIRLP